MKSLGLVVAVLLLLCLPTTMVSAAKPRASITLAQVLSGNSIMREGDSGLGVLDLQQRLNNIGISTKTTGIYDEYTSASVSHFQWKFFLYETGIINKNTAKALLRISSKGLHVPKNCFVATKIVCVDKTQKILRLYQKGKLLYTVDARFGGPGNETNEGLFRITRKVKNDYSYLYHTPMPYSSYFSGGQAIHYSMFFNAVGYNGASHGCINIGKLSQAKFIYSFLRIGTKVQVYH